MTRLSNIRLLILSILLIVLTMYTLNWILQNNKKHYINNASISLSSHIQLVGERISNQLNKVDILFISMIPSLSLVLEKDLEIEKSNLLNYKAQLNLLDYLSNIILFDKTGKIKSNLKSIDVNVQCTNLKLHRDSWIDFIIEVKRLDNNNYIKISRRIDNENGEFTGVIAALIDIDKLGSGFNSELDINISDKIILDVHDKLIYTNTNKVKLNKTMKIIQKYNNKNSLEIFVEKDLIVSIYKLPQFPYSIVISTKSEYILEKWYKEKQNLYIFGLILIGFILYSFFSTKKIKNEVEKNKQQQLIMLQQSRLAQMGEMINMIAHQWRQPLHTLSMLNQSMIFKYNRDKLTEVFMNSFKKDSTILIQNMSKTIDDFRDFFKPEKDKVEFILNDIINDALDMVKPIFFKNQIDIIFEAKEEFKIVGYPNELGQAIINILNNAKDALIDNNIKNKQINITLNNYDTNITLTIKDNANGIPKNIIDNIFDPYFSTKEEKNGTGLGLYMTKIIIEDHMGGKLSVSNDEDGAVFSIELK